MKAPELGTALLMALWSTLGLATAKSLTTRVALTTPQSFDKEGWQHQGCYVDVGRTINQAVWADANMTNAKCTAYCFEKGFVYAGTEYSSECYCGNWLPRGAKPAQVGECSDACAGDGTEACGGRLRLTLYKTNKLEAPEVSPGAGDWESMGCYTEGIGGRALESQVFSIPTENMTAQLCMNACEDRGFALSGVEYAGECYCGNELKNYARATVSDGCDMTCKGNHGELCGGANRLNLYKNKLRYIAPPRPSATGPGTAMPSQCPGQPGQVEQDWDFAGCYTEAGNNLRALHEKSWSDDAMSLASCSRYCAGFTYFGVEYGRECYCGDGFQGASARTADAECSMLCAPGDGGLQCEYCGAGNRLSVYKNRKLVVVEPSSSSRSSSTLRPTTLATTVSKPTSTLSTATSVGTSSKSTQLTPSLSSSTAGLSSSSQSTLSLSSTITSGNHSYCMELEYGRHWFQLFDSCEHDEQDTHTEYQLKNFSSHWDQLNCHCLSDGKHTTSQHSLFSSKPDYICDGDYFQHHAFRIWHQYYPLDHRHKHQYYSRRII
ncbi:WSCdomain-containing protein [Cordyceps javanica]|uniref:WSCdomain-containing protein n=1 Tax=Cordyceps javanica TaxID=43265 RepID=A0A545UXQ9_9HYPO|nr:WSCdomain-containing protein [Cordyceps javanica]